MGEALLLCGVHALQMGTSASCALMLHDSTQRKNIRRIKHGLLRLGSILFNTTIATAIADRLVENPEVFLLGGESLRKPKNPNPPEKP